MIKCITGIMNIPMHIHAYEYAEVNYSVLISDLDMYDIQI